MSRKLEEVIRCPIEDCIHNVDSPSGKYCETLAEEFKGDCPFYKTLITETLEQGALHTVPHPDWEAYRRHSGTKPVTRERLKEWLEEMEKVCPTDDPLTAKVVADFLTGRTTMITVDEAIRKVTDYLEYHREGCAWCKSPEETAREILEGDDE